MVDPIQLKAREDTWEEAKKKASRKAAEFNAIQHKVLDGRVAFYEKLALFDTGTIAATISMVAAIRQQQILHWENVLFVGWILLLAAMALCLIRNSCAHAHLYYEASAHFNHAHAEREEAGIGYLAFRPSMLVNESGEVEDKQEYLEQRAVRAKQYKTQAEKLERMSNRRFNLVKWTSWLATSLTAFGISCILVFSIKNLRNIPATCTSSHMLQSNQTPTPLRNSSIAPKLLLE